MDTTLSSAIDHIPRAISAYPTHIKLKLFAIRHLLTQKMKYSSDFQNATTELLKKYHERVDELVAKLNSLIKGDQIPDLEGTPNLELYFHQHEIARASEINLTSQPFPNYWYDVLMNSKLRVAIHPEEEEILKELEEITLHSSISKREKKFTLTFHFGENEYFSNDTLICTIRFDSDDNLLEAKTNKIYWFANKNLYNILAKNDRSAGGFFKLFKRFDVGSQNSLLVKYKIDINFIASELIHEIIPHSFHYYLGVVEFEDGEMPRNIGRQPAHQKNGDDVILIEERKE
jgi:Nucleosome assembly protein (NAP).